MPEALLCVLLALAACLVACATPSRGLAPLPADPLTLRLAMYTDASSLDPDVYYDVEATPLIHGLYDGLLTYAPDTRHLIPALATSWSVSGDRMAYTFTLRTGVRFHDGTLLTSSNVAASFARRRAVKQPSGYMLDALTSIETPTPGTVVVHLSHPVAPFLDYLASTWGPKIIGPDALTRHAGTDHGRAWLDRHDDGTGAFTLTRAAKGREYVLTRAPAFWGRPTSFDRVQVRIVGDAAAQQQQLRDGELDAVLHGYPAKDLTAIGSDSRFRVLQATAYLRVTAYVNTHHPALADSGARSALARLVDPATLVESATVQGESTSAGVRSPQSVTAAAGAYPNGLTSQPSAAPLEPVATETAVDRLRAGLQGVVTVGYTADESGTLRLLAEAVASRLRRAGLDAQIRETSLHQAYSYQADPASGPDLLLNTNTPDAAHPDTWARIMWDTTGGLNFLAFSDPRLDRLLDQASAAPTATAPVLYRQVAKLAERSDAFLDLADLTDLMVLRSDLDGASHVPAYPWSLNLADLKRRHS